MEVEKALAGALLKAGPAGFLKVRRFFVNGCNHHIGYTASFSGTRVHQFLSPVPGSMFVVGHIPWVPSGHPRLASNATAVAILLYYLNFRLWVPVPTITVGKPPIEVCMTQKSSHDSGV